jgi:putative sterol carrier protein
MTPRETFEQKLPGKINKEKAQKIGGTYQFKITGDNGGNWQMDLTKDADWIKEGVLDGAACVITCGGEDWVNIIEGKLNAQMAFMGGKLKVTGPDASKALSMSLKLTSILS